MNFEISAEGIELTGDFCTRVERRLCFALGRFADRIEQVRVDVSAETGRREGRDDTHYRIRVTVSGQLPAVLIEQADVNIEALVDWAADRVGRAVARRLDGVALRRESGRSETEEDRS